MRSEFPELFWLQYVTSYGNQTERTPNIDNLSVGLNVSDGGLTHDMYSYSIGLHSSCFI
jgi:hypothetical protein